MNQFLIMGDSPGSDIQWRKKRSLFFTKTLKHDQSVLCCQAGRNNTS